MGMGAAELKDIIDKHGKWLRDEEGGERANLSYADLRYANLSYANLRSADLRYADLSYADLSYANLGYADLSYADLSYANLGYADLRYADLRSANLRSADLSYADLNDVKKDFFEILGHAKPEVVGLFDALMRGKIDGSTYSGECACLIGTIANVKGINHEMLTNGLVANSSRPAERWFLAIRKGDVPQSNAVAQLTKEWVEEFAAANEILLPSYRLVSSIEMPEAFAR